MYVQWLLDYYTDTATREILSSWMNLLAFICIHADAFNFISYLHSLQVYMVHTLIVTTEKYNHQIHFTSSLPYFLNTKTYLHIYLWIFFKILMLIPSKTLFNPSRRFATVSIIIPA